ncbi:MAG TPA: response regulator, partial [Pseudobdellovibrionaceae bacterium]|nr:response regulator [Pseudobdellovibrionaceae bacterium]
MDKTNILIVDDRPENILALSNLIESDDIQIFSAESAEAALELLVRHEFALALLDVQMPRITGFELARLIRGVKKFKHLPVIFVTAQPQDQSVVFEGYETGAVDLMFKPLDPHVVRSKIRVFVQLDQQSRLLKSQMEQLEKLKQQAEVANTEKSHFLANMSHEIRTPLGSMLGFAELLKDPHLPATERAHYVDIILRTGTNLSKILNDVLDISKVEAGQMDVEKVKVSLPGLLSEVQQVMGMKCRQKGLALRFKSASSLPDTIVTDPFRLRQILVNLLGNAVKFTEKGSITVTTGLSDHKLSFTVEDTG